MNLMIETLEGRTMFSAAVMQTAAIPMVHHAAVHAVESAPVGVAPLHFQGTAYNTTQHKIAANLTLTLTKTDKGYQADVIGMDPNGGTPTKFSVAVDANGHLVYNNSDNGKKFHLEGQLNADKSAITGTWTEARKDRSSVGTIALTVVTPAPTPTPPPTPSPITGPHYVGTATDTGGTQSGLTLDVVKTTDGSYFGIIKHPNSDGTVDTITVKFDAKGHFHYTGDNKGNIRIEGQISADGKTMTGSYTITNIGSAATAGTFSLART